MSFIQKKKEKYVAKVLSMPYLSKKTIFIADLLLVGVIFTLSTSLCYSLAEKTVYFKSFGIELILCIILNGVFFLLFKTSKGVLRYSSFRDSPRIFFSLLCANVALLAILLSVYNKHISPTITIILVFFNLVIGFSIIFSFRVAVRLFFDYIKMSYSNKKNLPLLIFGTKVIHISLAKMIRDNEYLPYSIAGFISSDDSRKMNQKIMSYPIYSKNDFLSKEIPLQHIKALLIVSEELTLAEKKMLVEKCAQYKIELLSAPPLGEWKTAEKKTHKIAKLKIEDLLGRMPIQVDTESIGHSLKNKTILITGAAGSIGNEIVRKLCSFDVKMLLLCDIAETPLHNLYLEINDNFPAVKIQLLIADVRNYERMKIIFEQYHPEFVYHAAAYKHVPLMENQPSEAVMANVLGTKNVADLTVSYKSECFIMVSTDKAVNPSSVMGASKRVAEIYIQCLINDSKRKAENLSTRFITTRFGNVLGSNGSVIPRFTQQIEAGGPITVTHPDIIRYFMTISEACNLVLEASILGNGGEIFVFDMGEMVKIKDMAESMIRLSGLEPYKDINIIFTGLRPGEKLYEELLYDKEKVLPTKHEKIKIREVTESNCDDVVPLLSRLIETAMLYDDMKVIKLMKIIVPEFVSLNSLYSKLNMNGNKEVDASRSKEKES